MQCRGVERPIRNVVGIALLGIGAIARLPPVGTGIASVGCRDDRVGHGHDRLLPGLDLVGNQYLSDEEGIRKTVSKQRSAHIEPVI